jgi:Flp pilus assembly protein protease CpaA
LLSFFILVPLSLSLSLFVFFFFLPPFSHPPIAACDSIYYGICVVVVICTSYFVDHTLESWPGEMIVLVFIA